MTGWRLGYTVAPAHIVPALQMLAVNSYTCVAEFTQYGAIEALERSQQRHAAHGGRVRETLCAIPARPQPCSWFSLRSTSEMSEAESELTTNDAEDTEQGFKYAMSCVPSVVK